MRPSSVYQDRVDRWVSTHAANAIGWAALLESLPSVYPSVVRESAVRLGLWGNVNHSKHPSEIFPVGSLAMEQWHRGDFGTGHPLDCSWWFADQTLKELAERVRRLSTPGDLVALLGTPTLFHYLGRESSDRELVLVDRGACMTELAARNIIRADLLESHPKLPAPAAVVIIDPPWYGPEIRAFLWSARINSTRGTKILLSSPPVGTRPEIDCEWNELAVWCEQIGFRFRGRWPMALRYISPPFETNALRADGILQCPLDWRRGDLVLFECAGGQPPFLLAPERSLDQAWSHFLIGRICVKIRSNRGTEANSPILSEIVPDDILPSVSRRDHRLQDIALWTSGNRIFGSQNFPALQNIVKAMASGQDATNMLMNELSRRRETRKLREAERVVARLRDVFETEEIELEEWKRRLNANVVQLAS